MVLFYHRVANTHPNGWTISQELFARQVQWLKRNVDVISLTEAQQRIHDGRNSRPAATLTFDDGYADNCEFALPYLREQRVPCTYFVSSHHMLTGEPFPHDRQAGVSLAPNTPEQIQQLAAEGVDIGAHTRTHPDLARVTDRGEMYQEIVGAGDDLADVTSRPVRFFAFPYGQLGNMPAEAFRIAEDAGYQGVCSAYGGYNFPGQSSFFFKRIHGDPEMIRFWNWLTFDPRKHRQHAEFPYPPASVSAASQEQLQH